MSGLLGDVVGLVRDIVDRIPTPDPELRRAKLLSRLTRKKVRLEARLKKNPNSVDAQADLAGVVVELDRLTKLEAAEVPAEEGGSAPSE